MKIARLELQAFAGAPDGLYELSREGRVAPLTAVAGGPRAGKTSLLVAIAAAKEAVAPTGPPRLSHPLRLGAPRGHVEATWELDVDEAEAARLSDTIAVTRWEITPDGGKCDAPAGLRKLFGMFDTNDSIAKVELVPEELTTGATTKVPDPPALKSQRTALRADKYGWAPAALTQALLGEAIAVRGKLREQGMVVEGEVPDDSERFKKALLAVAPHLRLGKLADYGNGPEPTFTTETRPEGLPWSSLAATDRAALALAIGCVHLGLGRSVLLWDSPDRSFGPRSAAAMAALRHVVPEAQLVVALDAETPPPDGAHVLRLGG